MKKAFLLILFFIEISFAFAQNNFAKLIAQPQAYPYNMITKATADNEILVLGLKYWDTFKCLYLLDSTGNIKWSHKFSFSGVQSSYVNYNADYAFADDKGFMLAVGIPDQSFKYGIGVVRFDSLGNALWGKLFHFYRPNYSVSILNKPNGNFAICGSTKLPYNGANKWAVSFLVVDTLGNVIKSKRIGNDSIDFYPDKMKSIGSDYIIEGMCAYQWNNGYNWPFIMKLDAAGNVLVTKILNVSYYSNSINGLFITHNDKVLFTYRGMIPSGYKLIKLDENLNILWGKNFVSNPSFYFQKISELSDSTYCFFGSGGFPHAFKTDTSGNVISGCWINYPGNNYGSQMLSYKNKILFHSVHDLSSGYADMMITSDLNFNAPCYVAHVPLFSTTPFSITDSLLTMSNISNYLPDSVQPFSIIDSVLNYTITDFCPPLEIEENSSSTNFSIFPNPFTDKLKVADLKIGEQTNIVIYDLMGEKVFEKDFFLNSNKKEEELNLSFLQQGVYFLNVKANGESWTRKIVKM